MLPLGAGRVGGGGPAGGREGQTEVPGQGTVHGKARNRRLTKKEVTGMSKDTLAESQGEGVMDKVEDREKRKGEDRAREGASQEEGIGEMEGGEKQVGRRPKRRGRARQQGQKRVRGGRWDRTDGARKQRKEERK